MLTWVYVLAVGRAAEEIMFGLEEMSTINQRRITLARRIATKIVYSGAMTDDPAKQSAPLTVPYDLGDGSLVQMLPERVSLLNSPSLLWNPLQWSTNQHHM